MSRNERLLSRKIKALLTLFRFDLSFAAGVSVVMGELLALGRFPDLKALVLGFLSVFFLSAAALILNDVFDLEIDKVNAPHRPLPAGLVSKPEVIALSVLVTLFGLLASAWVSLIAFAVAVLVWLVGFLYNWRFKRSGLLGNLMVSFSVGMTFIFGGIVVGLPFEKIVWYFALLAMLIDLGEEIAADALDAEGDILLGSRSIAIVYGKQRALRISAGIFGLIVVYSVLPVLLGWLGWLYLLPFGIMDAVIIFSVIRLFRSTTLSGQRAAVRWIYLSGLAAMLIFLFMRWLV
jgi:geranylgeranylglycerol-phosphate geranylgeranyltransferase